jgi:hypothetical protein
LDLAFLAGAATTAFLCFALRALPRIGKPLVGHDTWYVLLVVDELKRGHGYNAVRKHFLIEGDHDYPPLSFYFLSMFPSRWLERYNWAINPILDSMNSILLFGVTYLLSENALMASAAAVIYSLTPSVLEESLNFNTRIFGLIPFNLTLVSLILHNYFGESVFLVSAIFFGAIVLLSHKFATQVLYLLLFFFALLVRSYVPLMILSGVVIGAIAFSGGFYFKILLGHIGITKFWLKHYNEYGLDYLSKHDLARTGEASKKIEEARSGSGSSLRTLWHRTRWMNPLHWLLKISPFNPFAVVPLIMLFFDFPEMPWQRMILWWSILTLIFFYLATYLRFLGHYPGRKQFLEYNAFPSAYLCSIFALASPSLLRVLVLLTVIVLSLIQNARGWLRTRIYNRSDDQSLLQSTFKYLKSSSKDGVLCLPASHSYAVPYFSGKKVFYTVSASSYEKLASFFPVLTVPLKRLIAKYDIHFVLVDTTIVSASRIDLTDFKPVMEENDYLLLERST